MQQAIAQRGSESAAAPAPETAAISRRRTVNARAAAYARVGAAGLTAAIVMTAAISSASDSETNDLQQSILRLKELPFEQLAAMEVTSVSREPERLVNAPSAVQVITAENIHRSGATSLPEALRLAPNLQVAQINSQEWAVSSRGFNSALANKLLVLIDGRTVYTPLFSGVFWDVQNVMLEDLDRIEVVSGPGATLWGANAVNGVINVMSKSADHTQGTVVTAGAGSFLRQFASVRYGDKIGEDLYFRIYGMGFERDAALFANSHHAENEWGLAQGGFRSDWLPRSGDKVTFQGDFYGGAMEGGILDLAAPNDSRVNGQNFLTRWTHPLADESDITLQAYWDRTWRNLRGNVSDEFNTFDLDFQHRIAPYGRHQVIWGLGYRLMRDDVGNGPTVAFIPAEQTLELFSGFLQDEIMLVEDRLFLTLGTKLEHNDYSGLEVQPSARLAWRPRTNQTVWAAVSRAVRSPARVDTEVRLPGTAPYMIRGGGSRFEAEDVLAYELGYRTELSQQVELSLTTFYHDYDDLASLEPVRGSTNETIFLNELRAETYGVELAGTWQVFSQWRLRGGYTYLKKNIFRDQSQGVGVLTRNGTDPEHQFVLQSMLNLTPTVQLDSVLRYVDNLDQAGPNVPSYVSLDVRIGWHPTPNWDLSIVGQNLLDNQHPEFGPAATRQEIQRSVYGKVTWKF